MRLWQSGASPFFGEERRNKGHVSRRQFNLAFNFNGDTERQFRHADGTAAVRSDGRPEHLDNEIGKAVDNARLLIESGRRVDHAEHSRPSRDSIEIAESAFQAAKNR